MDSKVVHQSFVGRGLPRTSGSKYGDLEKRFLTASFSGGSDLNELASRSGKIKQESVEKVATVREVTNEILFNMGQRRKELFFAQSGKHTMDDVTVNISQSSFQPIVVKRKSFMIQSHKMQNRRIEIIHA